MEITDDVNCVLINTKNLFIKNANPTIINVNFSVNGSGEIITNSLYFKNFTFAEIKNNINDLRNFARINKLKINGYFTIAIRTEKPFIRNVKVSMKKIKVLDDEVDLITKIHRERNNDKKAKTFEEKIELVCQYLEQYKELPKSNTIYQQENIGRFWMNLSKNKEGFDKIMTNFV